MNLTHRKILTMIALCLIVFIVNLDLTIISLAIAPIANNFKANLSQMQWVINSYLLFAAVCYFIGGRLGDLLGRKKLFIVGTSIFILGSLLAGISWDIDSLICFRIIQGIGFGCVFTDIMAIGYNLFDEKYKALALGVIISTAGSSQAIGPMIAGFILHVSTWHMLFLINIPIGLLAIVLVSKFFKEDNAVIGKHSIDKLGLIVLLVGSLCFVYDLITVKTYGFTSKHFIGFFILSLLIYFLLFVIEKNKKQPFINLELFKNLEYIVPTLIRCFENAIYFILLFILPLYLHNIRGLSILNTSYFLLLFSVPFGVFAIIVGKLLPKFGYKDMFMFAHFMLALGCVGFLLMPSDGDWLILSLSMLCIGTGVPFVMTASSTAALKAVRAQDTGLASSIFYGIIFLFLTLAIAFTGSLLAMTSHAYLTSYFPTLISSLTKSQTAQLFDVAHGMRNINIVPMQVREAAIHSFQFGFRCVALINLGFVMVAFLLTFNHSRQMSLQHFTDKNRV